MAWARVGRARERTTVVGWGLEGLGKWAWPAWPREWAWPDWPRVWARQGRGPAAAVTHLLQLQPHFVEGSQPVGLGSGHGVLTLLAFLTFSRPETEAGGS